MGLLHGGSDRCFLFTDVYSRLLQLLLAATALFMLYVKRKLEFPIRPFKVWALDVGKQALGSLFGHSLSIVSSIVLVAGSTATYDECGIYFVLFMVDTTWGAFLTIVLLRAIDAAAARHGWLSVARCGDYGDPPQMRVWWRQFVAYLAALLLTKVVDLLLLWALFPGVARFATKLFAAFTHHRHLELSLVMLVVPGCCNAVQFWIVDSYLKSDSNQLKNFAVAVDDCETHWIKPPPPARDGLAVKTVSPL